jgi:hypothetical protein
MSRTRNFFSIGSAAETGTDGLLDLGNWPDGGDPEEHPFLLKEIEQWEGNPVQFLQIYSNRSIGRLRSHGVTP